MNALTIAWLLLPMPAAFLAALVPALARPATLLASLATAAMALAVQQSWLPASLQLVGALGVSLQPDPLAAPFLLLNALVCTAVLLDGWREDPGLRWWLPLLVLHGAVNTAIVAADLISIYVALEVVGITTFLLLLVKRQRQQVWLAVRVMVISNTVMLLFLIGTGLHYLEQGSFALAGVEGSGAIVLSLLLVGLLTKAEVFAAGLWLPRTNGEGPAAVSALLSGTVVSAGVVPLLRLAGEAPSLLPALRWLGLASAAAGVVLALRERELRRLLAWSTLSQMGLVILLPAVGGLYALGHGLAKAALFLLAGRLPQAPLSRWPEQPLQPWLWWPLMLASLSIAGLPPLPGFLAKEQLGGLLPAGSGWLVTALGVGTVAVYARIWTAPIATAPPEPQTAQPTLAGPLLLGVALLLLSAGPWALPVWQRLAGAALAVALLKSGLSLAGGLLLHRLLPPPTAPLAAGFLGMERIDDLIGTTMVVGATLIGLLTLLL